MKRAATIFILFLSMTTAQAASTPDFAKRILTAHNSERATLGIPPLAWSDALAADAAPWAAHLAQTGTFQHSPDDARLNEGENLWEGTAGGYSPEQMVGMWAAEKRFYRHGVFKSGTSDGQAVGHYTQMIWKTTTQVGCALASGGGNDVLVCRYAPPGNFIGETPY